MDLSISILICNLHLTFCRTFMFQFGCISWHFSLKCRRLAQFHIYKVKCWNRWKWYACVYGRHHSKRYTSLTWTAFSMAIIIILSPMSTHFVYFTFPRHRTLENIKRTNGLQCYPPEMKLKWLTRRHTLTFTSNYKSIFLFSFSMAVAVSVE